MLLRPFFSRPRRDQDLNLQDQGRDLSLQDQDQDHDLSFWSRDQDLGFKAQDQVQDLPMFSRPFQDLIFLKTISRPVVSQACV